MKFSCPFHSYTTHLFGPFRSFHRLLLTDLPALSYISTHETFIFALYRPTVERPEQGSCICTPFVKSLLCISHCRECLPPYATKFIYG